MQTKAFSTDFEIKDAAGVGSFKGYASTFGNLDRSDDIVERGAFGVINPKRVRLLWQHKQSEPIGVWDTLREDDRGLYSEGRLNLKSARGQEAYELLKMGGLNELSIGFETVASERVSVKGKTARKLKKVNLFEISLVSIPANPEARVTDVKALDAATADMLTVRDFERALRDAGLSRKMAQIIAAEGLGGVEGYLESLLREAAAVSCKEAQIILEAGYRRFVATKSSAIEDGDEGDGDVRSRVHPRDADGEPEGSNPTTLLIDPVSLAAINAALAISGD